MDKKIIQEREEKLQAVSKQLKVDFIGLDDQIDRIIESIRIWFIMPELLSRPPIINLWGMTGTGKTDLVRKLSKYLDFADRLVEIQMDDEVKGTWSTLRSVKDAILCSDINEGEQGILLFDEFQRFEGKDNTGSRVKHDKFNDIWMLMSDGVFNTGAKGIKSDLIEYIYTEEEIIAASVKRIEKKKAQKKNRRNLRDEDDEPAIDSGDDMVEVFERMAGEDTGQDDEDEEPENMVPYGDKRIGYYKAKGIKKQLRLKESITELASVTNSEILELFKKNIDNPDLYTGGNYAKVLIFICGNLDDAYSMSEDVADADLSADILHKFSLKINLVSIKNCLGQMFFPEQVARLGNNHVIYPCLSATSYKKIIRKTLNEFSDTLYDTHGFEVSFRDSIIDVFYTNYVYPSQGVRPVFSGVNTFLSEVIPSNLFKLIEDDDLNTKTLMFGSDDDDGLYVCYGNSKPHSFKYDFELAKIKKKISRNKRIMYSVHEGGHALVYAHLFGYAPKVVNTEITSFRGAYVLPNDVAETKQSMLSRIKVLLAGTVAEEIVFGDQQRSAGCQSDIKQATVYAVDMVRHLNMSNYVGLVGKLTDMNSHKLTNVDATNKEIEEILESCREEVKTFLNDNRDQIKSLTDHLIEVKRMNGEEFCKFFKEEYPDLKYIDPLDIDNDDEIVEDYENIYEKFQTKEINHE